MKKNNPDDVRGKSLSAMSTSHLQELLNLEVESDHEVNVELIDQITAILDSRRGEAPPDVDAAWEDFNHNHLPFPNLYPPEDEPEVSKAPKYHNKHLSRVILIAAALTSFLVIISVTATASGFDLWGAVAKWSSETFGFATGKNEKFEPNPEYIQLREMLMKANINEPLIPTYLPDGYVESETYENGGTLVGVYQSNQSVIIIQVQKELGTNSLQVEKEDSPPEVYYAEGIPHYIMKNQDDYFADWVNNGYECMIYGVVERNELCKMIDSIYMEE